MLTLAYTLFSFSEIFTANIAKTVSDKHGVLHENRQQSYSENDQGRKEQEHRDVSVVIQYRSEHGGFWFSRENFGAVS